MYNLLRRLIANPKPDDEPALSAVVTRSRPVVVIGHSHLQALADAQTNRNASVGADPAVMIVQMLQAEFNPNLVHVNGVNVLSEVLSNHVQHAISLLGSDTVALSCISGNEYHALALVNHARPFDFVYPAKPDLPLQDSAEIIPAGIVKETMRQAMEYGHALLSALRAATGVALYHVQSPPPIPSDAYIREHPVQFRDVVEAHGVAPAAFRWKMWRMQSDLYEQACRDLGITFLPNPPDVLDASGFLARDGWLPDPTHANSWFGERVLRQLDTIRLTQGREPA